MSATLAHRVMDHGEQQRVHPFFGNFAKTNQNPDPSLPTPGNETSAADPSNIQAHFSLAPTTQNHGLGPQQPPIGHPEFQENGLEEDPNAERRKRLKTSTHETPYEDEKQTLAQSDDTLISSLIETGNPSVQKPSQPPRKILKLNTNGKLLSSPPTSSEGIANKASNKRKTKIKGNDTKRLVIIKYEKDSSIGKTINNIINGRERYSTSKSVAAQNPVKTTKNEIKPPKATHPFFLMKKPAGKATEETTPAVTNAATQHGSTKNEAELQPSAKGSSFSRSLFTKIPDLVPPIWPPKDLVHVRGELLDHYRSSEHTKFTQKKSKQRMVNIDESENILTCESQRIRKEVESSMVNSDFSALRVPARSVVSGSTLQRGIDTLLSHGADSKSRHGPGYQGETGRAHPGIAKVYASIQTSTTSFDSGTYDSVQWAQKYSPVCAEDVLQQGPEAHMIRDWLKKLMVSSVETGNVSTNKNKKKGSGGRKTKRRKTADKLDGFIVSSEDEASEMDELVDSDEDELASGFAVAPKRTVIRVGDSIGEFKKGESGQVKNVALISGPSGCGKSSAVYAVAKELDFEVFEINSGTRRSAKDILERVGDMTQNHLVQLETRNDGPNNDIRPADRGAPEAKQNKMNMFFKPAAHTKSKHCGENSGAHMVKSSSQESTNLSSRPHKQSLILLEEVDILFDEDKQFWIGVLALIEQSKRPVIMTCNNEDLVPLDDLSLHAIYRFHAPPSILAVDYLLVMAANEGHMLKREAVCELYFASNQDLRKSIMELDFWCQMAVGSRKSGIDWILDRWPKGSDVDSNGDRMKVISLHTYQQCMGWFNRDILLVDKSLGKESELLLEGRNWWGLNFDTDSGCRSPLDYSEPTAANRSQSRLESIQDAMILADNISAFDTLSHNWSLDPNEDDLDTTILDLSEKEKSNYLESYPLLIANLKPDYTGLFADIGSTAYVLMRRIAMGVDSIQDDSLTTQRVLARQSDTAKAAQFSFLDYFEAFDPIMQPNTLAPQPTGRAAPSFENGIAVIAEDLAPYIRSIVGFDLRLERYRDELNRLTTQGSTKRKTRTTRASRAALEGGSKSNTRRERWFSSNINSKRIIATGSKSWEDALAQKGYLFLPSAVSEIQTLNNIDSEGSQSTDAEAASGRTQPE